MGDRPGVALLRRSRERRAQFAALAIVVATATGVLTGILGAVDAAAAVPQGDDGLPPIAPVARAVSAVPLGVVAVIGVAAAWELARLIALLRSSETAVLRSRGASRGQLVAFAAVECAAVALPSAAVGTGAGSLAVAVLAGHGPSSVLWLAVPAAVLVAASIGAWSARTAETSDREAVAGRARVTAGIGGIVILAASTAVAVWQSAISRPVAGEPPTVVAQLLIVAAPALAMLTGAILVLAAAAGLARAADGIVARSRGLAPALVARRLARDLGLVSPAVLVVAFVAGTAVVDAGYGATWARAATVAHDVGAGAAVRITDWSGDVPREAATVLTAPVLLGEERLTLVAAPAGSLEDVLLPAAGVVDAAALAAAIAPDSAGIGIPDGTTELRLDVVATPGVELVIWIASPRTAALPLAVEDATVELPAPSVGAALVAVEIDIANAESRSAEVRIAGIVAETGASSAPLAVDGPWTSQNGVPELPGAVVPEAGLGLEAERTLRDRTAVRLIPAGEPAVPRIVVSTEVAERSALAVGDRIELRFEGAGRTVVGEVAAVVPAIPGTGTDAGALVDLSAFGEQQLVVAEAVPAPNELWAAEPVDGAAADEVLPRETAAAVTATALRIGALGGVVLAVVAVLAVAAGLDRRRRSEIATLRVLGVRPGELAATRAGELAAGLGAAVAGGVLVGVPVAAFTVPGLARIATPELPAAVELGLVVDPLALLPVGGILLVALALLVVGAALAVRRTATRPTGEV